jgi:hypothetical protein
VQELLDRAGAPDPPRLTDDEYWKLAAHLTANPKPPQVRMTFREMQLASQGDQAARMQRDRYAAQRASDNALWAAWHRTLEYNRLIRDTPEAVRNDPDAGTADHPADTSTSPGTPLGAAREAKGTTGTPKGRHGRKREPLTPQESDIWRLYENHKGSHDPYYQIVEILTPKYPHLEQKMVERIVRKVKARQKRDAEASRKPGTKSPVKRK